MFCRRCGSELGFVCKECGKPIEDLGPEHVKCTLCEAKAADRKNRAIGFVKKGGEVAAGIAAVVIPGGGKVIGKVLKVVKH